MRKGYEECTQNFVRMPPVQETFWGDAGVRGRRLRTFCGDAGLRGRRFRTIGIE
jgi:hypothetical protein